MGQHMHIDSNRTLQELVKFGATGQQKTSLCPSLARSEWKYMPSNGSHQPGQWTTATVMDWRLQPPVKLLNYRSPLYPLTQVSAWLWGWLGGSPMTFVEDLASGKPKARSNLIQNNKSAQYFMNPRVYSKFIPAIYCLFFQIDINLHEDIMGWTVSPNKFICWSPNPSTSKCNHFWR